MKLIIPSKLTERFVPNLEAPRLLEYFLISAVASLLSIRAYLAITGYPQIGGGEFHIAHMLWGGLFMLISIGILLSYINSDVKVFASVIGGIGFGTFIDELGKFITTDNDYFYEPTIAIIYVIFVLVFLFLKSLSQYTTYSSKTYTVNAVESIKELIIDDLNFDEKERAIRYLKSADSRDPIVAMLKEALNLATPKKTKFSIYEFLKIRFLEWYSNILHVKIISKIIVGLFISVTIISFVAPIIEISLKRSNLDFAFYEYGYFASAILSGTFTIFGVISYMRKKFLDSYQYLLKAAITSILLSQFFIFLENEFKALMNLLFFVTVYAILQITIRAEEKRIGLGEKV